MGLIIAIVNMILWAGNLVFLLTQVDVDFQNPVFYLLILVQTYLYTGLFITGYDAMHGTVSRNRFMIQYVTWIQLVIIAVLFNILQIMFPVSSILWFWVVPAVLSAFQLFYFGTYIPHKMPHTWQMGPHKARTLPKSHLLATISCYFFGYHREHHESPRTPWWRLYRLKT